MPVVRSSAQCHTKQKVFDLVLKYIVPEGHTRQQVLMNGKQATIYGVTLYVTESLTSYVNHMS
jgi:hypothetical protein